MTKILSKDNCLFYGLPGMVILTISTLATVNISSHFNENMLVTTVAFVGSNGAGWLAYLLLQYLLVDLLKVSDIVRGRYEKPMQPVALSADGAQILIDSKMEPAIPAEQQDEVVSNVPTSLQTKSQEDEVISNYRIASNTDEVLSKYPIMPDASLVPKEVISNDHLSAPVILTQKQYDKAQMNFDKKIAADKAVHERVIIEYVNHVMAPFVEHDNLVQLCTEIHKWCEDSQYNPEAIPLKYISDFNSRLKTIDFKHFIWNIGERMYNRTSYNGACRAAFVKALFPNALSDNTIDSMKNLTYQSDKGIIKLDRPKPNSIAFDKNK